MGKKRKKQTKQDNLDKQIAIIFLVIIGMVLISIVMFTLIKNASKFEYNGIEFDKTREGSIQLFTATIPVYDDSGRKTEEITIDFRNNPKNIAYIPVNITGNKIRFISSKKVYVSYDQFGACENNGLAGVNLGRFISNIGLDVKGAVNDALYENSTDLPYINCQTNPFNTVIRVINSTETKIKQTGLNCYEIHFKDCEVLEATERFELAILEQYTSSIKKV